MSADETKKDVAPISTLGWRERRTSEDGGGALAPFEPEIPATLQALAKALSSSARPRPAVLDEGGDDADLVLTGSPEDDDAGAEPEIPERASEPVVEPSAPPAPPPRMVPIAVPLPLVSPPPLEPSSAAPRPPAPRWRMVAAVAACCLVGLVAAGSVGLRRPKDTPAAPAAAATAAASPPVRAAVQEAAAPGSPAQPASPEPQRTEKASTAEKGKPGTRTAGSPCRVLSGKPCF